MSEDTSTFSMRLPSSLRERLGVLAKANHHSVNAEAVARLALSVDGGHSRGVFEALQLPRVLRLYATATSTDADRLLTVCAELEADLVILAARSDPLRDTVLVAIVRTPSVTCIMDTSLLTLARRPRVFDIQKLFKGLDALGLLQSAQTFETVVDDTSEMEPAAAVDHLLRRPRQRFDLPAFLALHGNGQALEASEFLVAPQL